MRRQNGSACFFFYLLLRVRSCCFVHAGALRLTNVTADKTALEMCLFESGNSDALCACVCVCGGLLETTTGNELFKKCVIFAPPKPDVLVGPLYKVQKLCLAFRSQACRASSMQNGSKVKCDLRNR